MLNIFNIVNDLKIENGGPSLSIKRITLETSKNKPRDSSPVTLIFQSLYKDKNLLLKPTKNIIVSNYRTKYPFFLKLGIPFLLNNQISKTLQNKIVILHGIWLPIFLWAFLICKYYKIPLVIYPHGMLMMYPLQNKKLKKIFAMVFYQKAILNYSSLIIATSNIELQQMREYGIKNPIAIIPHGIEPAKKIIKKVNKVKVALFLSRVHPGKGLPDLINAWFKVKPVGWELHIAGPDSGGHLKAILELIDSLDLNSSIKYVGPLYDDAKVKAFTNSDLFVLPSFSENFGLVIGEALSYGLPVITTCNTPWESLIHYKAGWLVGKGHKTLEGALRNATNLNNSKLSEMKKNAVEFSKLFQWNHVGEKLIASYNWVLAGTDKPPYIHTI